MSVPVAVSAFAVWTPAGVWLDTEPQPGTPGAVLAPWPESPPLTQIHPRARRPHPHAVSLVRLAHGLLSLREGTARPPFPPRREVELVLGTVAGSAAADLEFTEGLQQRGVAFGSPSTFVYTLPTAAPGEVALALGVRGALSTVGAGSMSGLAAVARAAAQVASGRARACLCGGMELASVGSRRASSSAGQEQVALFLLEAAEAQSPWPRLQDWEAGFAPEGTSLPVTPLPSEPLLGLARAVLHARQQPAPREISGASPEGHWARLRVVPPPASGS